MSVAYNGLTFEHLGHASVQIEEVHMSTFSRTEAGLSTEDLGSHSIQIDSLGDGDVVQTVRRRHRILIPQVLADTDSGSFLTGGEVKFARDRTGRDIEAWGLPL